MGSFLASARGGQGACVGWDCRCYSSVARGKACPRWRPSPRGSCYAGSSSWVVLAEDTVQTLVRAPARAWALASVERRGLGIQWAAAAVALARAFGHQQEHKRCCRCRSTSPDRSSTPRGQGVVGGASL